MKETRKFYFINLVVGIALISNAFAEQIAPTTVKSSSGQQSIVINAASPASPTIVNNSAAVNTQASVIAPSGVATSATQPAPIASNVVANPPASTAPVVTTLPQAQSTITPASKAAPTPNSTADSFKVDIVVSGYSDEERKQAFTKALTQLLARNSNNPNIMNTQAIKAALANPAQLVQSYTYVTKSVAPNAQGPAALALQVQFDQRAIAMLVTSSNATETTASAPKPQTIVWLVKATSTMKVLEDESSNDIVVTAMKKNAQELGMPIILPSLDLQDANRANNNAICDLNAEVIRSASQRYGVKNIIAGCIKQALFGNNWSSQWILLGQNSAKSFNFSGISPEDIVNQALQTIAPAAVGNVSPATAQPTKLTLRIANVNGLQQYYEVVRYLRSFSQVSQVELLNINESAVELNIECTGGKAAFVAALNSQAKLIPNSSVTVSPPGVDLDYSWTATTGTGPTTP